MRTFIFIAAAAFVLAVTPSLAKDEAPPPKPDVHPILDERYTPDASKHAVVLMVDWPVGADTGWHTHPGDEYATVLEGEVGVITKAGGKQSYRVYKAGEAYHNVKDVVHDARNVGEGTAKSVVVIIAPKGMPLSQPVK
jgi:quercetin dioxygenase-like cupin family protein